MSSSKLIDGSESEFERWELPHMGGQQAPRVEDVNEQELQPLTAEKLAEIEEQARQDGHKEGFDKGRREGLAAGKKHIDESLARLDKVIEAFSEPLQQVNEAVEEELINLAMAIAKQIIRREIQQDPQQILSVMREAMAELPSATRQVRIYLHPDDASLVREAYADHDVEERPWKIIDDMALSRGGCRIESQTSRIDASVEKRLNSVLASLMGGTRASDHDEEPDDDETQA